MENKKRGDSGPSGKPVDETKIGGKVKIGDKIHGGIVFYVDDTGQHGLAAVESEQLSGIDWHQAREMCSKLDLNKHTDWFLPSLEHLQLMYNNLHRVGLGGFFSSIYVEPLYWSSTNEPLADPDDPCKPVYCLSFDTGKYHLWSTEGTDGHDQFRVRAVRAF